MSGVGRGGGPRSNMYSDQRFTNWTPHDPYWSEVNALPTQTRPRLLLDRGVDHAIRIYERKLAADFVRPCTVADVAEVLSSIPRDFVNGLVGVYLMGGTARQARTHVMTYGMYWQHQIFLFPMSARRLEKGLACSSNPVELQPFRAAGALIRTGRRGTFVTFDEQSLRAFYLDDVLLHEVGHHTDRVEQRSQRESERFANWFAEYQSKHSTP